MSHREAMVDAYLKLIGRLGATERVREARRAMLLRLLASLADAKRTAEDYHARVDAFVSGCPPEDRVLAITCVREFYYFWLDDMKKMVEMTARAGFSTENPSFPWHETMDALLDAMQVAAFDRFPPSLALYLGKSFEDGADEDDIQQRERLLKALLYLLDPHPPTSKHYRMAVDALLQHLPDAAARQRLLALVREYFGYWQSFPFSHHRKSSP
ncbi:hypothetical protein DK842_13990 [Chromobacterium phragmitis]|uniref:Uncharacterized protein n=1 Tax=Chromobacterium phragmitis TaxID=2202141 RepID=A0A344UM01_9NEIS|nr:hypothetical protein [Chromobacterium phragmitis]AXE30902.1 hypothetical protein DK842_13990 [Chromobacterium phragmitis]AXE36299.1 hypothetical protein DK843_19560 [Chromobacterium phragmitis]